MKNESNCNCLIPFLNLVYFVIEGIRFALMQVKLALISVLLKFHITTNEQFKGEIKLDPKSTFLHTAKGGLWLRFEDLENV